jgi:recombination protein RecT
MENNNLFNQPINPASQAQINYLKKLGYTGDTEGRTAQEANQIINQYRQQSFNSATQAPQQAQQQYQPTQAAAYNPAPSRNELQTILANDVELADSLFNTFNEMYDNGQLHVPENYSIGNALKSALNVILTSEQCDKLLACSMESKKQALTEYVVQGLDASKKQAYFIPYGNKMQLMRSYFGDVCVTKQTGLIKDVYAVVIYEGDTIEISFDDYGRETLVKHETSFLNRDNKIIGAYGVAVGQNDYKLYSFMTRKELEASWDMSKAKTSKFLNNFQQEAAKRTVIRRLVKMIFNTSLNTTEQQTLIIGSYNRTTADEYDNSYDNSYDNKLNDSIINVEQEQQKQESKKKPTLNKHPQQQAPQQEFDFNSYAD